MIEDIPPHVEKPQEKFRPSEDLKRIIYVAAALVLLGAAFAAGRYTAPAKTVIADPYSQAAVSQAMGTPVPVPESAFTMINFSGVSEAKKAQVLSAFNTQLCSCNCKMTVASCILKDLNCPFWKDHVTDLQKALGNGKKPDLSKAPQSSMIMPSGMPNGLTIQPQPGPGK